MPSALPWDEGLQSLDRGEQGAVVVIVKRFSGSSVVAAVDLVVSQPKVQIQRFCGLHMFLLFLISFQNIREQRSRYEKRASHRGCISHRGQGVCCNLIRNELKAGLITQSYKLGLFFYTFKALSKAFKVSMADNFWTGRKRFPKLMLLTTTYVLVYLNVFETVICTRSKCLTTQNNIQIEQTTTNFTNNKIGI